MKREKFKLVNGIQLNLLDLLTDYEEKRSKINRAARKSPAPKKAPSGYFVKRINETADGDITIMGKRFICGEKAEPYDTKKSAETALKAQIKQDNELCGDMVIEYFIIEA